MTSGNSYNNCCIDVQMKVEHSTCGQSTDRIEFIVLWDMPLHVDWCLCSDVSEEATAFTYSSEENGSSWFLQNFSTIY